MHSDDCCGVFFLTQMGHHSHPSDQGGKNILPDFTFSRNEDSSHFKITSWAVNLQAKKKKTN